MVAAGLTEWRLLRRCRRSPHTTTHGSLKDSWATPLNALNPPSFLLEFVAERHRAWLIEARSEETYSTELNTTTCAHAFAQKGLSLTKSRISLKRA